VKAAVITRYGPPDVVEIRNVPTPVPRDNEVLVRVHASTVCYADRMIRGGPLIVRLMNGIRRPRTAVLGGLAVPAELVAPRREDLIARST
jgi:NADPH:quinone reductase-like Zn-dependent oxidoreductase